MNITRLFFCAAVLAFTAVSCDKEITAPAAAPAAVKDESSNSSSSSTAQPTRDDEPIILRGHIKRPHGIAISNGTIGLIQAGQSIPFVTVSTDSDGAYTVDQLAPGNYTLRLSAPDHVTKDVSLNAQADITRTDTLQQQ